VPESRNTLFYHWSDSLQKFDHFVAGLLGAWVAYLIRDLSPKRPIFWPPNSMAVELLGIAALIIALVAAVLRIGTLIDLVRISYDLAPFEAKKQELDGTPAGMPVYTSATSEPLTPDQLRAKKEHIADVVTRGKAAQTKGSGVTYFLCKLRNASGLAGILLIFASRILAAYCR